MRKDTSHTVAKQRTIQRDVDAQEKRKPSGGNKSNGGGKAMQAGARLYPEPPMPGRRLDKPGEERALALKRLSGSRQSAVGTLSHSRRAQRDLESR